MIRFGTDFGCRDELHFTTLRPDIPPQRRAAQRGVWEPKRSQGEPVIRLSNEKRAQTVHLEAKMSSSGVVLNIIFTKWGRFQILRSYSLSSRSCVLVPDPAVLSPKLQTLRPCSDSGPKSPGPQRSTSVTGPGPREPCRCKSKRMSRRPQGLKPWDCERPSNFFRPERFQILRPGPHSSRSCVPVPGPAVPPP